MTEGVAGAADARAGWWLAGNVLAERERWALWLPVLCGIGVAAYFGLQREPAPWTGAVLSALALAAAALARRRPATRAVLVALLACTIGFALAQARTARVTAPMLTREIGPVPVEGRVVDRDLLPTGVRVVMDRVSIRDLTPAETPARVRIRLTRSTPAPAAGTRLRVLAVLSGPSPPVAPGAFDFRRHAFFNGIGGIGYAVGIAAPVASDAAPSAPALALEDLRAAIGRRVAAVLTGDVGAIATALLNGERGAIGAPVDAAMRDSGLAHLLSISGLHVGLVAMIAFGGLRLMLALAEPVALRHPIKKWAAAAALLVALAYTLLVGAPVPTQRAFLMTGIVLLAVLLDRTALSMRLVAWAAAAVLAVAPDSVLGPSFQMSFGAVVALIAAYEAGRDRFADWRRGAGPLRLAALYVGGVALTTLVASLATTPFAVYHFQRIATYGLAANLIAVPLTSFWVMPWALIACALMPLGLEAVALVPMGWGVAGIIAVAETVASWPGAAVTVPAMPGWGIAAVALGGLWLCLWRRPWRLLGLAAIAAGLASPAATVRPDILVGADGALMAVRGVDGGLTVSSTRKAGFVRDIWLRRDGRDAAEAWPVLGRSGDGSLRCDPLGCLYRRSGKVVALVRDPMAFADDCVAADIVIAVVPAPRFCRAPVVVDWFDLWRDGAHAVTLGPPVRIDSVAARIGDRPWSLRRRTAMDP